MTEYEKAVTVIKIFMRMADEGSPGYDAYSYALKAMEKQNPLPVRFETNSVTNLPISFCPKCDEHIQLYAYGNGVEQNYCPYCGQAVKWE